MKDNDRLRACCFATSDLMHPPPSDAPAKAFTTSASRLKQVAVWLVGAGLLTWLLWQVPMDTAWSALSTPSLAVWALTLLGLLLSYLMRAARLQVVLGLQDGSPSGPRLAGLRLDALRVILMHNAAVNLLPMRAGELSFPWLASSQLGLPLARALASLLWMRLQDLAVLAALGLLLWPGLDGIWRVAGLGLLVAGWHGAIWLLQRLDARKALRTPTLPQAPLPKWRMLISQLQSALTERHHHRLAAWLFTWANWCIKLMAGALLLATIIGTSQVIALAGALGGELAAIVPLQGPAGFGTYEAGVWAGLALNLPRGSDMLARGVAAALALHVCFLLCAVVAGAVAWAMPSAPTSRLPG